MGKTINKIVVSNEISFGKKGISLATKMPKQ